MVSAVRKTVCTVHKHCIYEGLEHLESLASIPAHQKQQVDRKAHWPLASEAPRSCGARQEAHPGPCPGRFQSPQLSLYTGIQSI